jgi:hypothetical protein
MARVNSGYTLTHGSDVTRLGSFPPLHSFPVSVAQTAAFAVCGSPSSIYDEPRTSSAEVRSYPADVPLLRMMLLD